MVRVPAAVVFRSAGVQPASVVDPETELAAEELATLGAALLAGAALDAGAVLAGAVLEESALGELAPPAAAVVEDEPQADAVSAVAAASAMTRASG